MTYHSNRLTLAAVVLLCSYWGGLPDVAAKPPNKPPAVPLPVVDTVKLEFANDQLIVNGSALEPATVLVTLGGTAVAVDGSSTDTALLIPFSNILASIVNGPGNYTLRIATSGGSVELAVYLPYALPAATGGTSCPCQGIWTSYGAASPPDGFSGLTPYCVYESTAGDQVAVQFFDDINFNLWILTTEYTGVAQECALVIDEPTQSLDSAAEHQACAEYLRITYINPNPGIESCYPF